MRVYLVETIREFRDYECLLQVVGVFKDLVDAKRTLLVERGEQARDEGLLEELQGLCKWTEFDSEGVSICRSEMAGIPIGRIRIFWVVGT